MEQFLHSLQVIKQQVSRFFSANFLREFTIFFKLQIFEFVRPRKIF